LKDFDIRMCSVPLVI